jgi:pyruvate dehydrogenase E2 component (dihydrolipoamide acetyltransferase)
MPSLGADMETGTLVEWRVRPGDVVHRGDIVAVVDTEKSTIEVEVFEDGVVEQLLASPGDTAAVGTPLAVIGTQGADHTAPAEPAQAAQPAEPVQPATPAPPAPAEHPRAGSARSEPAPPHVTSPLVRHLAEQLDVDLATVTPSGPGGHVTRADIERAHESRARVSPRARRLAADRGISLTDLTGTGSGGAVTGDDVLAVATEPPPSPATRTTGPSSADPVAARRAAIGALMSRSKREIPHYYVTTTIDFTAASEWLTEINSDRPVAERLLPAVLLLKATARAAHEVPVMNGHYLDGQFQPSTDVELGVAISLRAGGLVAPVLHRADLTPTEPLMAELRDLVARARGLRLRGSDMAEPSITVTNLGDQGVETVLPVIYPPQVAMVGFGKVLERPWAVDGMLAVRPLVSASVAADHRANDGHDGARFLATIDRLLQDPHRL